MCVIQSKSKLRNRACGIRSLRRSELRMIQLDHRALFFANRARSIWKVIELEVYGRLVHNALPTKDKNLESMRFTTRATLGPLL